MRTEDAIAMVDKSKAPLRQHANMLKSQVGILQGSESGFLLSEKSTGVWIRSTGGAIGPSPKATPQKIPTGKKYSGILGDCSGSFGVLWSFLGFFGGTDVA